MSLKSPAVAVLCLLFAVSVSHAAPSPPPLYAGLGKTHHKVTTTKSQAQKYFDQGLALSFGFNHEEAYRAFERASQLDPQCAMAYWGMAYVLGPNVNWPMDPSLEPKAYGHIQKALQLASGATPAERDYIQAMAKRYAAEGSANRAARDSAYAGAMMALAAKYPEDPDAQALWAESLMDLRPWEYWTHDKKPNPGTEELVAALEKTLAKHPDHVGAIHLYIHAVEASPYPERGVPYAEKLPKLIPGAGHLVHMPTHLYRIQGRWLESKTLNEQAAELDRKYLEAQKPEGMYSLIYYNHNMHFAASAAAMGGESKAALDMSRRLYANITPEQVKQMPMAELYTPYPILMLARFGRWDEILALPRAPEPYRFTNAMLHYARGLALAAKKEPDAATAERDTLVASIDGFPDDYYVGLNTAKPVLGVAAAHLAGEIAARNGRSLNAVGLLRHAVALEDSLHYDEPPGWYAPIRQSLGAVYLDLNTWVEAEAIYREDLVRNPNNGWSLFGLERALRSQGKSAEADKVAAEFQQAWKRADVTLTTSRF